MDALGILRPDISPRATGHVIEQIELITKLIERGCAYEVNGNVYFDVAKDKEYGKLSGRKADEQEASGRVEARSDKRSPQDFALWKRAEANHIMRWPSPWGEGFPGWHIECSAMSMKYLGETIDIHGGGLENQFPHHECEIAQSECATGKPFVKYWMHNNMVTTGGVKMGKSLGNSAFLRDLYKKYNPLSLRFTILQSHYRSTTEFTPEAIIAAQTGYEKLLGTYQRLNEAVGNIPLPELDRSNPHVLSFIQAMDDDFNTAKAIALLYELSTETNNALRDNHKDQLPQYLSVWRALAGDVLGILPMNQSDQADTSDTLDHVMQLLILQRKEARDRRDFAMSDVIRKQLDAAGILLEDSKEGPTTWRLK
jgi:cysteinyl-tRNA synthetase